MKSINDHWQLQTAKARFSEVFRRARSEGPQYVTRKDKAAVVVIAAEEFERLTRGKRKTNLAQFFAESPLVGSGIDLERKHDFFRKVEIVMNSGATTDELSSSQWTGCRRRCGCGLPS